MRIGEYELWQSEADGLWYFRLQAGNNRTINPSQGYKSEQGARKGIRSIRINAPLARVRVIPDPNAKSQK